MAVAKTPIPGGGNIAAGVLDAIVARLQNVEPWNIYSVDEEGEVAPWYSVSGAVVTELVVGYSDLETQVRAVSGQIAHWARLLAQAQRVMEIEDRRYTQWKAAQYLAGIEDAAKEGEKKPSDKILEAKYRIHPSYSVVRGRVERAGEAANATAAVLEGFRAKAQALKGFAQNARDQRGPNTFSV